MSGVKKLKALSTALIVLFLMNSCADFFSTSWGEIFKRDPKNVKVNSSNVYDLLDTAKGDQELSRAILDKINADSDDTLKRAAITAANQAAGISTLALENIRDLVDAFDANDRETALRDVAEKIQADIKSGDLVGISGKLNEILADKLEPLQKIDSGNLGAALIQMGEIAAFVPMADGSDKATISIDVDNTGTGTATIATPDGGTTTYDCVINDAGTITLTKGGNPVTTIECEVDEDTNTLTLTDLDKIPGAALADTSNPFVPPGKPEFEDGFLESVPESDLTLTVMTLILAKAEKEKGTDGTLDGYLKTWDDKDVKTGKGLDVEEALIAAIVNGMIERGEDTSDLTKMIKDLLGVK